MYRYLIFLVLGLFALQTYGQRHPMFFQKERPLGVFLKKPKVKKLIKDYNDLQLKEVQLYELIRIPEPDSWWTHSNRFSFDFGQLSLTNWNAGGQGSINGLADVRIRRTYKRGLLRWNNEFIGRFGLNRQEGQGFRKTDDHLELVSTFGYKFSNDSDWYHTVRSSFQSQFTDSYNYPNRDNSISHFMAPGYFFLGAGAEYKIDQNDLLFYVSPLTQKTTFVLNQRLANDGAFGVREAVRDVDGNIISRGRRIRGETGILLKNEYRKQITEDIEAYSRLSLFTDYFQNFGNIDVDWELIIDFRVNEFIKARIGSHIRYDDDISVQRTNDEGELVDDGPRIQWKQQLGIGILIEI